ncbi:Protein DETOXIFICATION 15 [Phytophthora ramorum]|uniref:Protein DETOXIFICATION 15 n=1 Tax=Phytophthora ramorum TaxID=164328 RepID=UPI0030B3B9E8|nr:Protein DETOXIFICATION 15 [Phytophthora ramorum]
MADSSEQTSLLVNECDVDVEFMPAIITRGASFPAASPTYTASLDVVKIHDYDTESDVASLVQELTQEQDEEPEPVAIEEFWKTMQLAYPIPLLVINDPVAIQRASDALLVMVPYEIIDSLNCVIQGIYKGAGWQDMAAKTNVLAFYVIGIPFGALLSFHFGFGIEGLWIGFGVGIATAFTVCSTNLYYSSWEQMALEARARLAH